MDICLSIPSTGIKNRNLQKEQTSEPRSWRRNENNKMKAPPQSAILSLVALSSYAFAAVTIAIAKNPEAKPKIRRRNGHLLPRATITESLQNNATGGDYIAQVSVGTPAQVQTLLLDTGSSDVWMLASTADLCTDPEVQNYYGTGGCSSTCKSSYRTPLSSRSANSFCSIVDPTKSSTYKVVDKNGFDIEYEDQSGATGDYITDNLSIGGATIKTVEMGLAYNSSSSVGVMGIGYDVNEASNSDESSSPNSNAPAGFTYPGLIDKMVSQGLIATKAYSLHLDDLEASTGSIIFGGLDSDKYHGSLLQIPIVPDTLDNGTKVYAEFGVALTGFGITSQTGSTTNLTTASYEEPAILDSGTTATYLPDRLVDLIIEEINGVADNQGNIYVDCNMRNNASMTFNFGFGGANGVTIKVPVSEMVFDLDGAFSTDPLSTPELPFNDACAFGILPGDQGPFILGDTFLRSAYVVYDLQNNLIAIAQTNFNSTTSSIVDFQVSATSIPNVSGVASSASVMQTATGVIGNGGGQKTATGTATGTASGGQTSPTGTGTGTGTAGAAMSSTGKSAAVKAVPAFDVRGLLVMGISAAFAVLGGGLFLA